MLTDCRCYRNLPISGRATKVTTFLEDHNEIQPTKHSHSCTEIQRYEDILTLNGKYVGPGSRLLYTNQATSHLLTSEAAVTWNSMRLKPGSAQSGMYDGSSCRNKPPWRKVSHAIRVIQYLLYISSLSGVWGFNLLTWIAWVQRTLLWSSFSLGKGKSKRGFV